MKIEDFNGVKYYVGRSAKENWQLLDDSKNINGDYIWFHLNSFASPYVIMYTTINELLERGLKITQYIEFGARLCHLSSKFKFLKNIKIMYIPVRQVTKTQKLGEVEVNGRAKIFAF